VGLAFFKVTLDTAVASRFVKAGICDVAGALSPALLSTLAMGMAVWGMLTVVSLGNVAEMALGVFAGALVYIGTLWVVRRDVVLNAATTVWDAMRALRTER
jgi:hypothetical protein